MNFIKLLPNVLLVAVILFSFTSCDKPVKEMEDSDNYLFIKYDGKRPKSAIGYKEIAKMLKFYDKSRGRVLDSALNKKDARENWIQIDSLKKYIAYIETMSDSVGIEVTGINIMAAAYPKNYKDKNKSNLQTIIFVPTTKVGSDNKFSFDPIYSTKNNPKSFEELLAPYMPNKLGVTGEEDDTASNVQETPEDKKSSAANRTDPNP